MAFTSSEQLTSSAVGLGKTALVDASWSDDNLSLFPSSYDNVTIDDNTCGNTDEVGLVFMKI